MDIRCRKTECKYNDRYTCMAKGILIDKQVLCSTYEDSGREKKDVTKSLFEEVPNYAPQRDSKTMAIDCCTNCLFNKEGKCISNGITVNAIAEKPFCVSYLKK